MSGDRSELKKSLKEDALEVWNKLKEAVSRYGKYGMLALGLTANMSSTAVSEQDSSHKQYIQKMNDRGKYFDNRLTVHELKTQTAGHHNDNIISPLRPADEQTFTDWNKIAENFNTAPWLEKDTKKEAENIYKQTLGDNISGKVSVKELMDRAGVTAADIQAVVDQNPEMAFSFEPGQTGRAIERAARRIQGLPQGKCLSGMQTIVANSGIGIDIGRNNPDWPEAEPGAGKSNSACNVSIPLEKSGKFITVSIDNEAYQKRPFSPEYQKMQELNRKIPGGTIVSIDNKMPDEISGRRYRTSSETHGHTWTPRGNGEFASDGVERSIHFHNYGEKVHLSYATDCGISEEMAIKCIEQAQIRKQKEQQLAQAHKFSLTQQGGRNG